MPSLLKRFAPLAGLALAALLTGCAAYPDGSPMYGDYGNPGYGDGAAYGGVPVQSNVYLGYGGGGYSGPSYGDRGYGDRPYWNDRRRPDDNGSWHRRDGGGQRGGQPQGNAPGGGWHGNPGNGRPNNPPPQAGNGRGNGGRGDSGRACGNYGTNCGGGNGGNGNNQWTPLGRQH